MGLLDTEHHQYFICKTDKKLDDTEILDIEGQPIGFVKVNKELKQIEIQELDGNIVFILKRPSLFSKYEIKNRRGNVLADFKSEKNNKIILGLTSSDKELVGTGGKTLPIIITQSYKEVGKAFRLEDVSLDTNFDFDRSVTYGFKILQMDVSRLFPLAFFIFLLDSIKK